MSIVLGTFSGDMLGAHWLFNDLEIPSMKSSYFSLPVFLNLFIYNNFICLNNNNCWCGFHTGQAYSTIGRTIDLYPIVIASEHFPNVRFSRPSILFALAATERTCGFQDKSDDIMTPRCLCVLTCSSGIELMLYEHGVTDLDLDEQMMADLS